MRDKQLSFCWHEFKNHRPPKGYEIIVYENVDNTCQVIKSESTPKTIPENWTKWSFIPKPT